MCVSPDEPAFAETLGRIVAELDFDGGVRRYPSDTYYGGGAWPVLTASLGWYYAAAGDLAGAQRCQDWVTDHFDDQGRLGEQFGGDRRDPEHYLEWVERWGRSAADLLWSHAMYVVLAIELAARNQAPAATTPLPMPSPQPIPRRRKGTPHDEEGNRLQQQKDKGAGCGPWEPVWPAPRSPPPPLSWACRPPWPRRRHRRNAAVLEHLQHHRQRVQHHAERGPQEVRAGEPGDQGRGRQSAVRATSWSKFIAAAAAGNPPALLRSDIAWVPTLAAEGLLLNMSPPKWAQPILKGCPARPALDELYEGGYYGLPDDTNTQVFFWNKADFAAAGLSGRRRRGTRCGRTRTS